MSDDPINNNNGENDETNLQPPNGDAGENAATQNESIIDPSQEEQSQRELPDFSSGFVITPEEVKPKRFIEKDDIKARFRLFQKYALEDQRNYYDKTVKKNKTAASQVNRVRATTALLTAICSALVGFLVLVFFTENAYCHVPTTPPDTAGQALTAFLSTRATVPEYCGTMRISVNILIVLSVVMPALGGFFNSLADLYQWDRLAAIYDRAAESIEIADAYRPDPTMADEDYTGSLGIYATNTLLVMRQESAQWGQEITVPEDVQAFAKSAQERAAEEANQDPPPLQT